MENLDAVSSLTSNRKVAGQIEVNRAAIALLDAWLATPEVEDNGFGEHLQRMIRESGLSDHTELTIYTQAELDAALNTRERETVERCAVIAETQFDNKWEAGYRNGGLMIATAIPCSCSYHFKNLNCERHRWKYRDIGKPGY